MAYNRQSTAQNNNQDQSWKSQGFINMYLPRKDGKGNRKLGAIPLKEANAGEKALLEWLKEDPTRVEKIKDVLIMEFKSAEPEAGATFALPV